MNSRKEISTHTIHQSIQDSFSDVMHISKSSMEIETDYDPLWKFPKTYFRFKVAGSDLQPVSSDHLSVGTTSLSISAD